MVSLFLFIFGTAIGSFVNVVAVRYRGDRFLLSPRVIGGRSHCPKCKRTLQWFELIPLVSFVLQRGRCGTCGKKISLEYPLVELLSGLIFVFVPLIFSPPHYTLYPIPYTLIVLWLLVFLTLLIVSVIDIRLRIIPDEANIFLGALGIALTFIIHKSFIINQFTPTPYPIPYTLTPSFIGHYALLFGFEGNVILNHLFSGIMGGIFFYCLVLVTRGRGMGMGDVKLAVALGLVFGWPDIALLAALSFIVGSLAGVGGILAGRKKLKSMIPFGPFLAIAALLVFFFGFKIVDGYFKLFGIF